MLQVSIAPDASVDEVRKAIATIGFYVGTRIMREVAADFGKMASGADITASTPIPPPPNTPPLKENTEGAKPTTVRERLEEHRRSPACASCHATMDPLGFALENFDAIGQWRPSPDATGPASLQLDPDQFAATLTEKLLTFALGRGLDYNDAPAIRHIARGDHHFSSLILGIIQSPQFQMKVRM